MSEPEFESYRAELLAHCYRMLASVHEAEDAVQETYVRALAARDTLRDPGAMRGWLYRIATRQCLDRLRTRSRRFLPIEEGECGRVGDALATADADHWIEPMPDALVAKGLRPDAALEARENIRLAFVAALQLLPPRQRAVLLMRQVLGWSAADVADLLSCSEASVNSAMQRAKATLSTQPAPPADAPLLDAHAKLLDRFVVAFEAFDLDALLALLRDDATLSMPPYRFWLRGVDSIREWLLGPGGGCQGSRLLPVEVSGQRGFAQYREGGRTPWAVLLLDVQDGEIAHWTTFLDVDLLFPRLGLPMTLAAEGA